VEDKHARKQRGKCMRGTEEEEIEEEKDIE